MNEEELSETKQYNILSGFILKIIALIAMTCDHVGVMMDYYSVGGEAVYILRAIGRLALPLFCFLLVEGVLHTKSFKKYILRLGICALLILIAQLIMQYGIKIAVVQGNIFIDLILGALAIKCLQNKNIYVKLLAILPVLFGVFCFIFFSMEYAYNSVAYGYPYFLRAQYFHYSIVLIILFYLANIASKPVMEMFNLNPELYKGTNIERLIINALCFGFYLFWAVLNYVIVGLWLINQTFDWITFSWWEVKYEMYGLISGALLLLYSGQRGYNRKWFQYGCYAFYPLHLLIIYGIFVILFS